MTPIRLNVRLSQPVPSFKNTKRVSKGQGLFTPKKIKARMEEITRAIALGLHSSWKTAEDGMQTGCSLQHWIASRVPLDDSTKWVPSLSVDVIKSSKPDVGFQLIIERLP